MKKLIMTLIAILMVVSFTSCSKEDTPSNEDDVIVDNETDENPTIGKTKKLVRFVYENENKYLSGTDVTFIYNEQGFL